jgi:hypothetical protein
MHTKDNELWVQTGAPYVDHDFWGRPEEFPFTPRPSQRINSNNPGNMNNQILFFVVAMILMIRSVY